MKKSIAAIALIFMAFVSVAQQDPQFSQNMFNRLYPNPAFAGAMTQYVPLLFIEING